MYNEKVIQVFQNPKHVGVIENPDATGKVGNSQCGDIMELYLKISDGIITDAKFKTFGCTAAIASMETACGMITGMTLDEAAKVRNSDVVDALGGLPSQKIHCSLMAEEVIAAAIEDFNKK